jgi:hypothetical protein
MMEPMTYEELEVAMAEGRRLMIEATVAKMQVYRCAAEAGSVLTQEAALS